MMIQHFDLRDVTLHDGDLEVRPCTSNDEATLVKWFAQDGIDRWQLRVVDEFTIWPFMILANGTDTGFLQVWRTNGGVGGLEIFVVPQQRREGIASRTLRLIANYLRDKLGWHKITIEPHADDEAAIRCYERAGFLDFGERRDDGDHTHIILEWP
jgi:RimJ/RimL family protein N-acetyltransferase